METLVVVKLLIGFVNSEVPKQSYELTLGDTVAPHRHSGYGESMVPALLPRRCLGNDLPLVATHLSNKTSSFSIDVALS